MCGLSDGRVFEGYLMGGWILGICEDYLKGWCIFGICEDYLMGGWILDK